MQRLLIGMEICQAAKQRSEPARETNPGCLKLQVVYTSTLAAGWSSGALLTLWNSELLFLFKPLESESGDLTWFVWTASTHPEGPRFVALRRSVGTCVLVPLPSLCLLWFPPTQKHQTDGRSSAHSHFPSERTGLALADSWPFLITLGLWQPAVCYSFLAAMD